MRLLDPNDYPRLRSIVSDEDHNLAVVAVANGRAAGCVLVDDSVHPRLALVSPHWGRLYLLGRAGLASARALRESLSEIVIPLAMKAGASVFTLAYPPDWQPYLADMLAGMRTVQAEREYYRWAGQDVAGAELPPGFTLVPADAILLANDRLQELELLREEMASERASVEDFLARSFGIAAVYEDRLAGWCLSEYNTETRCEVGIATLEPFQRRGLAAAMGSAFLDMARAHGVCEVGWHCWKQNIPSAAAAVKIGLHHVADIPVCVGWYNEAAAPQ